MCCEGEDSDVSGVPAVEVVGAIFGSLVSNMSHNILNPAEPLIARRHANQHLSTTGTEIFLHLYQNSIDSKEHLAIVFGNTIRSTSLDAHREGETEMDRMIRGAYTGRLYPGRTSSQFDDSPASSREPSRPSSAASNSSLSAFGGHQFSAARRSGAPLVRIHSECYTGETAWSARCDCGEQLDEAARLMALDPAGGVVVYLRQEGRGIGLGEKLKAYNLQDLGNDTVQANLILRHPADARSYGLATAILKDLEQSEIRLLTNNPDKIAAVEGPGKEVRVVERVPMIPLAWKNMKGGVTGKEVGEYLRTKVCLLYPDRKETLERSIWL